MLPTISADGFRDRFGYVDEMDHRSPCPDRALLILDLDETLIYANETPIGRPCDFEVYGYAVYRRPHLAEFLDRVSRDYDLAVWSSASDDYVKAVVSNIFPDPAALKFVWGRSRATLRRMVRDDGYGYDSWDHRHYLKPLKKVRRLGWPLERTLIVDDTPEKCARNYGNAIYARPFEGDEADTELLLLSSYLATLKDEPNVRRIEKRRWRERAGHSCRFDQPHGHSSPMSIKPDGEGDFGSPFETREGDAERPQC